MNIYEVLKENQKLECKNCDAFRNIEEIHQGDKVNKVYVIVDY